MQFLIDITLTLFCIFGFLLICAWSWRFWKMYVNQQFLNKFNADCILLEIRLPREVLKSPKAMEIALAALVQGSGMSTWYDRNVKGGLIAYFSLEIASLEGVIHFYIRTHKKFQTLLEAALYAQYPGIEISKADDYTAALRYNHLSTDVDVWGVEYPLSKTWAPSNEHNESYKDDMGKIVEMPADYLPIKTYVDYELDKDPDEEFKINPITQLLEFMGTIGKNEYLWYQVMVQDDGKFNDKVLPKAYINSATHEHMNMVEMANARRKQIRTGKVVKAGTAATDNYGNPIIKKTGEGEGVIENEVTYKEDVITSKKEADLTQEEKDELDLINRKLSKPYMRAIVRLLYVGKKESFNYSNIQNILSTMRPYSHGAGVGNGFGVKTVDPYSYPWEDTFGKRVPWRKEEMFEIFVEREGFYPHIGSRPGLDKLEDIVLWNFSMETRKLWRMMFESIFYPFDHPHASVVSLNLEELATLWHFPGAVVNTPKLPRIDSAKGVAPLNLPQ